ncbi:hypothetical protein BP5796_03631 [Coleophoma crateriformis]|uniref:Zn(2)-C6 fungal-type domain-containing protein n=1 Tax=Coleophoma crateriformis TaxID=565419 RepID=A0A3D8SNR4_9HELO|nr:hypothetical protein BP5796_03631 [Coleophoma crateriformis]
MPLSTPTGVPLTRACQNCSHAKAKCVPQPGASDEQCARCFRLKKTCNVPPRTVRKKRSPNTATHVAQLEQKIEHLVTLIAGSQAIPGRTGHLTPPESQRHNEPSLDLPLPAATNLEILPSIPGCWGLESDPQPPKIASALPSQSAPPQLRQSQNLLRTFREKMQPQFPFVVISADLTSEELRVQRPWLHRAVLIAGSFEDRTRQMESSTQYILDISRAIFITGEKSLDMLESLLVYNVWSFYYSPITALAQSSGLHQLAHTLVFDLGLTKPVSESESQAEMLVNDAIKKIPENDKKEIKRTNNERRALLCCYYIGSLASLCAKKCEGLQHSAYLEFCCQLLTEAAEHESDLLLVALVRLHSLVEPLSKNLSSRLFNDESKAPIWMHINSVRVAIQHFWDSLPSSLQQNSFMITSYHCAELIVYEPSMQNSLFTQSLIGAGSEQRLDMLYSCLNAAQKVLEYVMARPLSTYYITSMIEFNFMRCGLITLLKLSLLETPGWHAVEVRQKIDPLHYYDHIMVCLEKVGTAMDLNQPPYLRESFPTLGARSMKGVRAWYEAVTNQNNAASQDQQTLITTYTGGSMQDWMNIDQFDYLDEALWLQSMGNTNFTTQT